MNINQFITSLNVKPADAIVMQKKFFGMLDHYVIYLGLINRSHTFVANYTQGVRVISNQEINQFLQSYVPTNVDRFPGRHDERGAAVQRAKSLIGQRAYDFIANNCEHFKNYVHKGIASSTQVERAGAGLAVGGIALAAIGAKSESTGATVAGIALAALGLIAIAAENSENKN
jgi:hypothetical protein